MNVLLWILQVVVALHTGAGAAFKYSHSPEQTMASFKAIPPGVWTAMGITELVCAVALIVPVFSKKLGFLIPLAASYVIAEMLLFSALQVHGGDGKYGSIGYWLVVAGVCAFIAYGRFVARPVTATA
jgi:hypothetical protein